MLLRKACLLGCLALRMALGSQAQTNSGDTLRLTLQDADARFVQANYQLLAAKYNVEAQEALKLQARLFPNPVLNTDFPLAANGRALPFGKSANAGAPTQGQYYIQLQFLIQTAGKRHKAMELAATNARMAEWQLADLTRTLRQALHEQFFQAYQLQNALQLQLAQQATLASLEKGMAAQLKAGNISQKEMIRVQALRIQQEQDLNDLRLQMEAVQASLRSLLQWPEQGFLAPQVPAADLPVAPPLPGLLALAQQQNPGYQLQQTQVAFAQQQLTYQKALAKPDLTLGPNFDHASNFAPNYLGLGISMPLALFNRNQGNIRSSGFAVRQEQAQSSQAADDLKAQLTAAVHQYTLLQQQQAGGQHLFMNQYEAMANHMVQAFASRQLSLLEFIDFFQNYTNARLRQQQLQLSLYQAAEQINYLTGTPVLNLFQP